MVTVPASDLKKATIKSTLWNYLSHYLGKILLFITTVVLARLLFQADFGLAGYALTVIGFLEVISDLGLGTAIIYYKDEQRARDTAFWLALLVGSLLGIFTFALAPFVGSFFNDPRAVPLTQAMALFFPISALKVVPEALLRKGLAFGKKIIPDLIQTVSKGLLSIVLALLGFGAWSLIIGPLIGTLISVVAYWTVCPWRPQGGIAREWLKPMTTYGLGIVGVNLLAAVALNVDYLIVGRYLGAAALGVYTLAFRIPELIILQFCSVLSKVMLPVYARMREETDGVRRGFLLTTRYVSLLTVPMGLGLALLSEPFVLIFFGERWVEAIPVMQAIAIYATLLSLAYHAGDVYKAEGSPNLVSALILVRLAVLAPLLWWAVSGPGTLVAVAWAQVGVAFVGSSVNLLLLCWKLRLRPQQIFAELRPAFVAGAAMALAVWAIDQPLASAPALVRALIEIPFGAAVYAGVLWVIQRDLIIQTSKTMRSALLRGQ